MNGYERIAHQFRFNETMLDMVSEGFGEDEWRARLGDANSAHWILGHLAHSRRHLLRRLGAELAEEPWEAAFAPGVDSEKIDPASLAPTAELNADFKARGDGLSRYLVGLTDEAAAEEWTKMPDGDSSLGGGIRFLFMHECYHIGQVGFVRRAVGKAGFV